MTKLTDLNDVLHSLEVRGRTQFIARCVDPNCLCEDRRGVICRDKDDADFFASRGYQVTPEEVLGTSQT